MIRPFLIFSGVLNLLFIIFTIQYVHLPILRSLCSLQFSQFLNGQDTSYIASKASWIHVSQLYGSKRSLCSRIMVPAVISSHTFQGEHRIGRLENDYNVRESACFGATRITSTTGMEATTRTLSTTRTASTTRTPNNNSKTSTSTLPHPPHLQSRLKAPSQLPSSLPPSMQLSFQISPSRFIIVCHVLEQKKNPSRQSLPARESKILYAPYNESFTIAFSRVIHANTHILARQSSRQHHTSPPFFLSPNHTSLLLPRLTILSIASLPRTSKSQILLEEISF
jgi:hypothetical protein